jgi:hypothetical protein
MRREDDVVHAAQRRQEFVLVALGLLGEDVDGRAQQLAALERLGQRLDIDHGAARCIDQNAAGLHGGNLGRSHHAVGGGQLGHMQGDDVGLGQQLVETAALLGIAQRQRSPRRGR